MPTWTMFAVVLLLIMIGALAYGFIDLIVRGQKSAPATSEQYFATPAVCEPIVLASYGPDPKPQDSPVVLLMCDPGLKTEVKLGIVFDTQVLSVGNHTATVPAACGLSLIGYRSGAKMLGSLEPGQALQFHCIPGSRIAAERDGSLIIQVPDNGN